MHTECYATRLSIIKYGDTSLSTLTCYYEFCLVTFFTIRLNVFIDIAVCVTGNNYRLSPTWKKYSPRKGTPAAAREDQIPPEVKAERFERLLAIQNEISLQSNKPLEDKTVRVLCDGPSKNDANVYNGRTDGGKIVLFDGKESYIGKFLNIHVDRADTFALYGTVVK